MDWWIWIDLKDLGSWITMTKDVLTVFAAFLALWISWRALTTWERQMSGQNRFDVARRVIRSTVAMRDAINVLRMPVMMPVEMQPHPDESDEYKTLPPEFEHVRGQQRGYRRRDADLEAAYKDYRTACVDSEALWGHQVEETVLAPLVSAALELRSAIKEHLDRELQLARRKAGWPHQFEDQSPERGRQIRALMYGVGGPDDDFARRMVKITGGIEETFRPLLKGLIPPLRVEPKRSLLDRFKRKPN